MIDCMRQSRKGLGDVVRRRRLSRDGRIVMKGSKTPTKKGVGKDRHGAVCNEKTDGGNKTKH